MAVNSIGIADKATLETIKNTQVGIGNNVNSINNNVLDVKNKMTSFSGGSTFKSKTFDTPGTYTWTVPVGVTGVFITAISAGGGGGAEYQKYYDGNGKSGGITSFGNKLSLTGGGGGTRGGYNVSSPPGVGAEINEIFCGFTFNGEYGTCKSLDGLHGAGGKGGYYDGSSSGTHGGSSGGSGCGVIDYFVPVNQNEKITIIIGAGGVGGIYDVSNPTACNPGKQGQNGFMLIKWWE